MSSIRAGFHGGKLVDKMVKDEGEKSKALARCNVDPIELSERQACDVELLCTGAFSPLEGFMNEDAWNAVLKDMRLPGSNVLFGLPVVLDTNRADLVAGKTVALNFQGKTLAVMDIESAWRPNKPYECQQSYGFTTLEHPGCRVIAMERAHTYIGGPLTGLASPERVYPVVTPAELRKTLPADKDVVAFQCRNPIHRAHYELFIRSLTAPNVEEGSVVLVHPTCGPTQEDDIDGVTRFKTYEVLKKELNNPKVFWSYLPYSMHMAGPREAIQHMIMRKNYGCTHFIVGRDMAGCKSSLTGDDFYGQYDAQDMAKKHAAELGMQVVPSLDIIYTAEKGYVTVDEATGLKPVKLSGTEFRRRLRAGEDVPEWFAFKSVVDILRKAGDAAFRK
jgi:sulfate adenylyltransferase